MYGEIHLFISLIIIAFNPSRLGQKLNPPLPIIPAFLIKSLSKEFPIAIEKI